MFDPSPCPTFAEFAVTWRVTLSRTAGGDLKRSTAHEYGEQIDRYIGPRFGGRRLNDVTRPEIDDWLRHLLGSGLHPCTVQVALTALRRLLNDAVRADLLAESPAYRLQTRLRRQQVSRDPIPAIDIAPIVEVIQARHPLFADIIALSSQLGTRIGECLGLRPMHVDRANRVVHIRRSWNTAGGSSYEDTPKNGDARTVPLSADALEILERRCAGKRQSEYLFLSPRTGQPYTAWSVRYWFKKALAELGFPTSYKVHCLRHSFGTELVSAGVDEALVGRYLGHRDHKITRGYTRSATPPRPTAFDSALHFLHDAPKRPPLKALVPQPLPGLRLVHSRPKR